MLPNIELSQCRTLLWFQKMKLLDLMAMTPSRVARLPSPRASCIVHRQRGRRWSHTSVWGVANNSIFPVARNIFKINFQTAQSFTPYPGRLFASDSKPCVLCLRLNYGVMFTWIYVNLPLKDNVDKLRYSTDLPSSCIVTDTWLSVSSTPSTPNNRPSRTLPEPCT